jgi:hypothetical protein
MVKFTRKVVNEKIWLFVIAFLIVLQANLFGKPKPPIKWGFWEKTYGSGLYYDDDCGYSVRTIGDGYIITGYTQERAKVWLLKTDSDGDTIWTKQYAEKNFNCGYSVEQTSDGGCIIAGYTCNFDNPWYGDHVVYLIKTNSIGNTCWTNTFTEDDSDMEKAFSVKQTIDGGYIITGHGWNNYTNSGSSWTITNSMHATSYPFLLKVDAGGELTWMKRYMDELPYNHGYSVLQNADGGYIFTGGMQAHGPETGPPGGCAFLMKTKVDGEVSWFKTFDEYTCGFSISTTKDSGYIITGSYSADGFSDEDVWLMKINASGSKLWSKTFGDEGSVERGYQVKQDIDEGYVLVGYINNYGSRGADVWLIKTDSLGDLMWSKKFGGDYGDYGYSLDLTSDDGYIITGSKGIDFVSSDLYLIKYVTLPVLDPNTAGVDGGYTHSGILEVSPNPFSEFCCVEIKNKKVEIENIQVYDRSGRLIRKYPLCNNKASLGDELRPGVYFIKAEGCKPAKLVKLD